MHRTTRVPLAGAIAVILASTLAAAAAELPNSGDFHLRYTMVNVTSIFGPVARGSDASAGVGDAGSWMSWLMSDGGSDGFGHKMAGKCAMMLRQNAGGYDLVVGNCAYSDADGDQIFESIDGLKGAITGGTGKYAGISGTLDLTDIAVMAAAGYEMVSGVKVGSYEIK